MRPRVVVADNLFLARHHMSPELKFIATALLFLMALIACVAISGRPNAQDMTAEISVAAKDWDEVKDIRRWGNKEEGEHIVLYVPDESKRAAVKRRAESMIWNHLKDHVFVDMTNQANAG